MKNIILSLIIILTTFSCCQKEHLYITGDTHYECVEENRNSYDYFYFSQTHNNLIQQFNIRNNVNYDRVIHGKTYTYMGSKQSFINDYYIRFPDAVLIDSLKRTIHIMKVQ